MAEKAPPDDGKGTPSPANATVTNVTAGDLVWDDSAPPNEFGK